MGLRYLRLVDGHDLPMLINLLEFAKNYDRPIVLHVLTKKGKGEAPN
jgi:1-deoxy-D-xylulose-5-phosphate synthase